MNITSLVFVALAFLAALIYRKLPGKWRSPWLLLISAAFVASWSWQFIVVLLLFGLINYAFGLRLARQDGKPTGWVIFAILTNLLILFIFKYNHFYQPGLTHLLETLGFSVAADGLKILLPVGLSFLVVQNISYVVDVAGGRLPAERDLIKFWVYVLYFPKLLSGPVERARDFLPRLSDPLKINRDLLEKSLSLLVVGFFRKVFLADALFRTIPDNAFISPLDYAGQHLLFWLLGYAFAIYNDFAGYTAIARGISLWFGIELNLNFNLPYLSHNFTEFWNRWHISLSTWLRDYIFYPLSLKLTRRFRQPGNLLALAVPPLATMLVSGMWHGLAWNMLVWGGLHALFLIGERIAGLIKRPIPLSKQSAWQRTIGVLVTFILAVLAWIPFKMNLLVAKDYFIGLFKWVLPSRSLILAYLNGTTSVLSWSPLNLPNPLLLLVLVIAIGFDLILNRKGNERELRSFKFGWQIVLLWVMLLLIATSLFTDSQAPFVYQGF